MIIKLSIILTLGLVMIIACTREEGALSEDDKTKVQAAMKEFVDAKLAENNYVYKIKDSELDIDGEFDYLHDGVQFKNGLYISCADVKVDEDVYDIDYYVKEEDGEYTVVKEVLHKIKGGDVNRLLWEKE
jgi:hypothetical protein